MEKSVLQKIKRLFEIILLHIGLYEVKERDKKN